MKTVTLGLRENRVQFTWLVLVNAFVGGMVGMERSILPELAEEVFGVAAHTLMLSFIIGFGLAKAMANYFAGTLAHAVGRKNTLILGWLLGVPVPFILMYAPDWNWVVFANILLGINQGLAWSSTVVMKMDLAGEKQRGFAMGLNEFSGYLAVALVAFLTGWIASEYSLRPYPFYIGVVLVVLGLTVSILIVRDTKPHLDVAVRSSHIPRLKSIFWDTSWRDKNLSSVSQAGLVNNLNDGMVWGVFPLLLAAKNFTLGQIGVITALYPAVWGIGQLYTGRLADKHSKRELLFWGMLLQAATLFGLVIARTYIQYITLASLMGWGTAMVYPTFLVSIAEHTHPLDRAKSIGVFRLWRDLGYAVGALLTGVIADVLNVESAILLTGLLTLLSAVVVKGRMDAN